MNYLRSRARLGHIELRMGNLNEAHTIFINTASEFLSDNSEIGRIFTLEGLAELSVAIGKPEHGAGRIGWANAMHEKSRPHVRASSR